MRKISSSMQLTRAADYAVRVMIYLAGCPARTRVALPELARAAGTPVSFLSKVLQSLTRAGLIESRRGKAGGFSISARGRGASMREVIEAVDGPIRLNVCLGSGSFCDRRVRCAALPVWARAQHALLEALEKPTIAELAGDLPAVLHPESAGPLVLS